MDKELVSIVVPIYNVEKYLKKCIDTILNQSYRNLEIILVDDGSTDKSGKLADDFAKSDKRITVIHKENGGLSDARNKGLAIATGKYICFIDSDDYIEKNMIEEVIDNMKKENSNISFWGFYVEYVDENEKIIKRNEVIPNRKIINTKEQIKTIEIDMKFLKCLGYAWNKMYKMDFLKKEKLIFEKGLSGIEDTEFNCRVFKKTNNFIIIDKAYNHYVQRNRETLGNKKYGNLLELNMRFCECHKMLLSNWNIEKEQIEKIYLQDYLLIAKGQIKNIVLDKEYSDSKKKKFEQLLTIKGINNAINNKEIQTKKERIFCYMVKRKKIFLLRLYYTLLT